VRQDPATGPLAASAIARRPRMSTRTMRRRLDEEGTSFRRVVDLVRSDLARQYTRDAALPLAEVAYRLGFADVGTFSRAFKRWTRESARAYRQR
jgi:AraC-like DNA-binding protein